MHHLRACCSIKAAAGIRCFGQVMIACNLLPAWQVWLCRSLHGAWYLYFHDLASASQTGHCVTGVSNFLSLLCCLDYAGKQSIIVKETYHGEYYTKTWFLTRYSHNFPEALATNSSPFWWSKIKVHRRKKHHVFLEACAYRMQHSEHVYV